MELPDNFGFSRAVNEGIYASRTPYVLLLNNDTEVDKNFVGEMLAAIKRHKKAFSCSARLICYHDRDKLDDAGNYYSALGWAYARGKGKISIPLRRRVGYLLHAPVQLFTVRRFLRKSDILMKSILHIWKILMWAIVPESLDMRTGMCQLHWSIMWAAEQAAPDTISLRPDILQEIIFI